MSLSRMKLILYSSHLLSFLYMFVIVYRKNSRNWKTFKKRKKHLVEDRIGFTCRPGSTLLNTMANSSVNINTASVVACCVESDYQWGSYRKAHKQYRNLPAKSDLISVFLVFDHFLRFFYF